MSDPLRDRRPVKELADTSQRIEISGIITDFERLSQAIDADLDALQEADIPSDWRQSAVSGWLVFRGDDRQPRSVLLEAKLETRATLVCQRCLAPFEWPLSADLKLRLTVPGVAVESADGYELWELEDDIIRPIDIIDEALTIALPFVARHDGCVEIEPQAEGEEMTTPFASLRSQMDEGKQD